MKSTLETLIKLAELVVDEKRLELKDIQSREDELILKLKKLAEKVETEKVAALQSTEAGFAYGTFVNWAKDERGRLENLIEELQPELEEARANLAEAFAEQKKVEITKERRDVEFNEDLKTKEQNFLDEFTTSQFHQNKKD